MYRSSIRQKTLKLSLGRPRRHSLYKGNDVRETTASLNRLGITSGDIVIVLCSLIVVRIIDSGNSICQVAAHNH